MVKRGSVVVVAAGLVLTLGGCGGGADEKADASGNDKGSAAPTPTRPPSEELVEWVGGMCESTTAIKELRTDSATDLKEIRQAAEDDLSPEVLSVSYLSGTPSAVEDVESDLEALDRSGVPAADRLLDAWLKKVNGVVTELDGVSPSAAFDDAEGSAAGVDKLVQSLTSPRPDLLALTKKDPQLAAAYKSAEQCAPGWKPTEETAPATPDPTGPLPKAADGKNTDACSDGACEVLVTSPEWITANGVEVHVTPGDDSVTFETPSSVMRLGGQGGVAKWGDDLKVTIVAQNKEGAVLEFTVP
ncbi:hypothetical protein [Streptomyces sp. V4I2]|uniref:hypothetical protein n=1 Tax=Streptomyces sp. V4I2 TaxID=3042280 RepID=UPI00277E9E6A|nr:hypothetical protein [Streptomyces sp. V4I2]MDQ1050829.1 hypothetical protein [Streptomyces sp. V4I2]